MLKQCAIRIVRAYQLCISPMLGRNCRFHPTCSEYAIDAFTAFGFWKGLYVTLKRLIRCNPFSRGGYDPVNTEPM